jgi:hypothetical protein
MVTALNQVEVVAQEPDPTPYYVYLPIILVPQIDARYDFAAGGLGDCCENQLKTLNLKGIGLHQHRLLPLNGAQTFQVAEWYDWYNANRAPGSPFFAKPACVWSRKTNSLPTPTECTVWIQANPGQTWIIGNEPNLEHYKNGSQLSYQQYARMYHDTANLIRTIDPTAKVAVADVGGGEYHSNCSIDLYDPYEWLENAIKEHKKLYGPMAVDRWTLHIYTKDSPDISFETNKVRCFRQHMLTLRNQGYWTGPYEVWVTELGWAGYDEAHQSYANVSAFMINMTNWLEGRPEVTRWFWWTWGKGTVLIDPSGHLTPLGQLYSNLARQ